jgi:hypothetical protein
MGSKIYVKPFIIRESIRINARCFRNNMPVSGTASMLFEKVHPLPEAIIPGENVKEDGSFQLMQGMRYWYYEGEWDSLPDFSKLEARDTGSAEDFTFSPRKQEERFGFVYKGYILIPATDIYSFYTDSDDGSRLYIDGQMVVDNDGLHALKEQEGSIPLDKGLHEIKVTFFERTGGDALTVSVRSPVMKKQVIPRSWLMYVK